MSTLLANIYRDMDRVRPEQLPTVVGILSTLLARAQQLNMMAAQAKLLHTTESAVSSLPDAGHYLNAEEVSERFRVTKVWLYRHKRKLPHSQPSRKVLLFPERAISQWFANRNMT